MKANVLRYIARCMMTVVACTSVNAAVNTVLSGTSINRNVVIALSNDDICELDLML